MRILYLYARKWYDTKMSIGRILYGEAVARHPGVELRFGGSGWPGWNDQATVAENVRDWTPDIIWVYKPEEHYPSLPDCPIPKLVIFNEANAPKTLAEIYGADATLVGFHHQNDLPGWKHLEPRRHLLSLPHCCDIDPAAKPLSERPTACLATGVRSDRTYPLRGRMMDLIHKGRLPGVVRNHPGYRLTSNDDIRRQYESYRADLRNSQIALCCSSVHRYALAKYVEAAAAGCLVVGDMPDDECFRETLGPHIVEVPSNADDELIQETVQYWIDRPDESQAKANAAREVVRRCLTTSHYAERLTNAIRTVI